MSKLNFGVKNTPKETPKSQKMNAKMNQIQFKIAHLSWDQYGCILQSFNPN